MHRIALWIGIAAVLLSAAALTARAAPPETAGSHLTTAPRWRTLTYPLDAPSLAGPRGLSIGLHGDVYVADRGSNQIQILSRFGQRLAVIGRPGRLKGEFSGPSDVTFDAAGNIYVADTFNNRIDKLSPSGTFLTSFKGGSGGQAGFSWPEGVTVDRSGNIYVADHLNQRVEELSSSYRPLKIWDFHKAGNVGTLSPFSVAVDAGGDLYVADGAIRKFGPTGQLTAVWAPGSKHGFGKAIYVTVDRLGAVYCVDSRGNRVVKLSPKGKPLSTFGSGLTGHDPLAVGVAPSEDLFVTNAEQQLRKISPNHHVLAIWGMHGSGANQMNRPLDVAAANGVIYVADSGNNRVQVLDLNGKSKSRIRRYGTPPRAFKDPVGITGGGSGNIFVNDFANHQIEKLSASGALLRVFKLPGSAPLSASPGQQGLAVDKAGRIFIADPANDRVDVLGAGGKLLARFPADGTVNGQTFDPTAVAVNSHFDTYVVDSSNNRIVEFSPAGKVVKMIGKPGKLPGELLNPSGLVLAPRGNLFVADAGNSRVQEFSPSGKMMQSWGPYRGAGIGQFNQPSGIALDAHGNLYLADTNNDRIDVLPRIGH